MTIVRSTLSMVLLLSLVASAGCGGIHAVDKSGVTTKSLTELVTEVQDKKESYRFPEGGLIVRVPKGSRLPLKLALTTPFATMESGDSHLRFEQDIYLYIRGRSVALSPDGERWARLSDWRAVKRLFGAGRGTFTFGAGMTKEEGMFINVALGLLPRAP